MARKRRPPVPDVLWRVFRNRARTLSDTILSLLPPPAPSPELCRCKGRRCLCCSGHRSSFLIRPDDPSDYRRLLTKCFVVVAENAPSICVFRPHSGWPQNEVFLKKVFFLTFFFSWTSVWIDWREKTRTLSWFGGEFGWAFIFYFFKKCFYDNFFLRVFMRNKSWFAFWIFYFSGNPLWILTTFYTIFW